MKKYKTNARGSTKKSLFNGFFSGIGSNNDTVKVNDVKLVSQKPRHAYLKEIQLEMYGKNKPKSSLNSSSNSSSPVHTKKASIGENGNLEYYF